MVYKNKFMPAPMPKNENRRLEAVRRTGVMDVDHKDLFIVYNELAKQISKMSVSYTGLIDENRQYFLCHIGFPEDMPESVPRESTFCQFALESTRPLIVKNCKNDKRFKNHPIVSGPPFIHFYAGFPIVSQGGYVLGTLCVSDSTKEASLDKTQIELLVKLTGRLAHQLETQSVQREFTTSRTIELLKKIKNHFPDFSIECLLGYLTIINRGQISDKIADELINRNLIDKSLVLTSFGRRIQKEIGLDSGIYKRFIVSQDEISSNLDNMLDNLESL